MSNTEMDFERIVVSPEVISLRLLSEWRLLQSSPPLPCNSLWIILDEETAAVAADDVTALLVPADDEMT